MREIKFRIWDKKTKTLIQGKDCPDGVTREIGGRKLFEAGSFKIINKSYNANK